MNNYKRCPLKKRPVFYEEPIMASPPPVDDQPQDLSLKRKAADECESAAKRNFALNLTVNSLYDQMKPTAVNNNSKQYIRPESPISITSDASQHSHVDNYPSPPRSDNEYPNIHLRGLSPTSADNSFSNGFVLYNPLTAVWNNYALSAQPSMPTALAQAPTPNYQITPPSSPNSYTSSEPEDLSVRNDIPLPALFHMFEEAPSASNTTVNTKNYRFKCDKCSKMYSTSIGLSKHQQYHCPAAECNQEKKQHSCQECGKLYTTLGALKMHIRTHILPCKCPICGKAFSRPWLLQGHIRTHTGEKPFSCTDCNRSFADRSNLRAHQQTHVEVKKYACKVCDKSFSRMSLLNKHANSNCTITIV